MAKKKNNQTEYFCISALHISELKFSSTVLLTHFKQKTQLKITKSNTRNDPPCIFYLVCNECF